MNQPSILMVSSEASPYAKSGGLADVVGALPAELVRLGHRVAVVIPRYQAAVTAPARRVIDVLRISMGPVIHEVGIWELVSEGVTFYFVDSLALYGRDGLYGDANGDFGDNHIRFAVLCRAAMEIARLLFPTDIYHCHDWQASLLPVYLKTVPSVDPTFLGARTLLTIHNLGYQGLFPPSKLADVDIPFSMFRPDLLEFYGNVSTLKAGIVFSDWLSTVSKKYAEEIQTPEYGFGLDGLLRARSAVLTGILNGADFTRWNPANDPAIAAPYTQLDLSGKRECKAALLAEMGLPATAMDRPLFGIVSRFAGQKGFDLIADIAWDIFPEDVYLAALGNGEPQYEELFARLQQSFPGKVAVRMGYNDGLAHRIEAGADIFLMPSRYEPCGLNQIYSLRYGTVPVVRATGGLDDTIDAETGFKFYDYSGPALLAAVNAAVASYEDQTTWQAMMVRGMQKDFSWAPSALEYSKLYRKLHPVVG